MSNVIPALMGLGATALQLNYFGINEDGYMLAWGIAAGLVFARLRAISPALLSAAALIVIPRLPGLGPRVGMVVFALSLLVLWVCRDAIVRLARADKDP